VIYQIKGFSKIRKTPQTCESRAVIQVWRMAMRWLWLGFRVIGATLRGHRWSYYDSGGTVFEVRVGLSNGVSVTVKTTVRLR